MSDVTAKLKSWLNGLQRRVERLEELMPRTEERPPSKSGSASPLVKVNADMTADDTKYDCVYLDADGTTGDTIKAKRPPGNKILSGCVGTLLTDIEGDKVFAPADLKQQVLALPNRDDTAPQAVVKDASGNVKLWTIGCSN